MIQNVPRILYIETKGQQLLLYQWIDYVRNRITTNHETYQSLVYKTHPKLFLLDIYQISISRKWPILLLLRFPQQPRLISSKSSLKRNGIYSIMIIFLRNFIIHPQSRPKQSLQHTRSIPQQTYQQNTPKKSMRRLRTVPTKLKSLNLQPPDVRF